MREAVCHPFSFTSNRTKQRRVVRVGPDRIKPGPRIITMQVDAPARLQVERHINLLPLFTYKSKQFVNHAERARPPGEPSRKWRSFDTGVTASVDIASRLRTERCRYAGGAMFDENCRDAGEIDSHSRYQSRFGKRGAYVY